MPEIRVGQGFDVHPFSKDAERVMILGGVRFDGPGLAGHSDADVIAHACIDALLGAAGLGDIGERYPDTEVKWAGADSMALLSDTVEAVNAAQWKVANVDCTVILETPRLAPPSRNAKKINCGNWRTGNGERSSRRRPGGLRPPRRRGLFCRNTIGANMSRTSGGNQRKGKPSRGRPAERTGKGGRGGPARRNSNAKGRGSSQRGATPVRRRSEGAVKGLGGDQVEGRQAVRELLLAGHRRTREVVLAGDLDPAAILDDIIDLADEARVTIREVPRGKFESMAKTEAPQGVLALAAPLQDYELEDLLIPGPKGELPFLLMLDGVTDPGNLGAILRSAECAGVTGVILPKHRAARITATAAKSAAGSIEHLRRTYPSL
mgnify:CR=1 FL=1